MADSIGKLGIFVAIITVLALTIYLVIDIATGVVHDWNLVSERLINFIMIGITISMLLPLNF